MSELSLCMGVIIPQMPNINIFVDRHLYNGFGSSVYRNVRARVDCHDCGSSEQVSNDELKAFQNYIKRYHVSCESALKSMNRSELMTMFMHNRAPAQNLVIADRVLVAGIILDALSLRISLLAFKKKFGCKCDHDDYAQSVITGVGNLLMTH